MLNGLSIVQPRHPNEFETKALAAILRRKPEE